MGVGVDMFVLGARFSKNGVSRNDEEGVSHGDNTRKSRRWIHTHGKGVCHCTGLRRKAEGVNLCRAATSMVEALAYLCSSNGDLLYVDIGLETLQYVLFASAFGLRHNRAVKQVGSFGIGDPEEGTQGCIGSEKTTRATSSEAPPNSQQQQYSCRRR